MLTYDDPPPEGRSPSPTGVVTAPGAPCPAEETRMHAEPSPVHGEAPPDGAAPCADEDAWLVAKICAILAQRPSAALDDVRAELALSAEFAELWLGEDGWGAAYLSFAYATAIGVAAATSGALPGAPPSPDVLPSAAKPPAGALASALAAA